MSWLKDLFSARLFQSGTPVTPQRTDINFEGPVTVLDDPVKQRTRVIIAGSGTSSSFNDVTVTEQIALGSGYTENAGPFQQVMSGTGSPFSLGSWTVPSGQKLTLRSKISVTAAVSGFGVLWGFADSSASFVNAGAGVQVAEFALGAGSVLVPPFANILTSTPSGNTVTSAIAPVSAPAWVTGTSYVGSLFSYTGQNPPTAIMGASTGCSVVSHGGNLYACTNPGGGASTVAPTGTGTITTGDGYTWSYLGSAAAGLGYVWTQHQFEVFIG